MPRVISHSPVAAALAAVVALSAAPAQAASDRTFVSAAGSDSNNCANVATPCRHFATAFAATAPGGEIFVLDPANYGSLTITYAVSIEGHGWASIAPPNGGAAITINAGPSDAVTLSGLEIDGAGGGYNGIVFNSGGSLTVTGCVVQNLQFVSLTTGNGILIQPASGAVSFVISNTTVANNHGSGIHYFPQSGSATATGVIDHVVATHNGYGIAIDTSSGGGSTTTAISNSIASNNGTGIYAQNSSAAVTVSIDNTEISGNPNVGIEANTSTKVTLGRSVITANFIGLGIGTSSFFSYKDNRINENTTDVFGPAPSALTLQ
jgi:Periplasmic copper-binding protein (NosD)